MIHPFKNDEQVLTIGDLTIENHFDVVQIFGELSIAKCQDGLTQAMALQEFTNRLVAALENEPLDQIQAHDTLPPEQVDNPFA
ncbi:MULTISPECIES: hypothetical protein [Moraxella]|uniref:Uncharacterized protein n=1 Tax=Moraxella catarrhalis TaxID=480 RepID=A0A7Z1A3R8_MORCA|nr:hypothetical protein [Moraxella catarrhalis]OAV00273.1 hypothetical protein AO382_1423 [Moraxella catarrhalis]STY82536.1 Uncharacterised protein [Moraxella catarrhalis]